MNQMMEMVMGYESRNLSIKHIPGPEGVRGRNSGAFCATRHVPLSIACLALVGHVRTSVSCRQCPDL